MEALMEVTTRDEQKLARESLARLKPTSDEVIRSKTGEVHIKIQETGASVRIPGKAFALLLTILANMSKGNSITLIPSNSELSTQQAADMLNVSRPHLVKLLEQGALPFKKVGRHRRILLQDLNAYESRQAKNREEQLKFLARQAQEQGLGYE
jgi:excisionase family DNA binding protein